MTVAELISFLQGFPPNWNIYMASDPKGECSIRNIRELSREEWFNWQRDVVVIYPGLVASPENEGKR